MVWRYLQSMLLVLLALAISIPVHFVIQPVNLVMLFLAAVVLAAVFLGRGQAILVSILSVLAFDFFLTEPRLSLNVKDSQYLLTFFGLLAVGIVISTTVAQLRRQVEVIRQREAHAEALNSLSRDLTGVTNLEEMLRSVVRHVHESFGGRVVVVLASEKGLRLAADSSRLENLVEPGKKGSILENSVSREVPGSQVDQPGLSNAELAEAAKAFRSEAAGDIAAGSASETGAGRMIFLPLRTSLGPVGVLGVEPGTEGSPAIEEAKRTLLDGFANLAALAIERARLAEQASQALVLKDIERLQSALLNSISHELRTPLVSITGALSSLVESEMEAPAGLAERAARRELVETAYEEARRMNLLVGNLLDMSRLESGALRLHLEPCDLQDLVGISLERFSERNHDRVVETHLSDGLPIIDMDVTLMVQVLVNLLENAAKYSPRTGPIELVAGREDGMIRVEVCDRGPGVAPEDLKHIFDKFYRTRKQRTVAGLGLGLSISKGIVEAHGGQIEAHNRDGGGLAVVVRLPIGENSK